MRSRVVASAPAVLPPSAGASARQIFAAGALLAFAVLASYHTIFPCPLFFDDLPAILENPSIRRLSHLGEVLSPPANGSGVTGRPLVNLSFALNYALDGTAPEGYHALNLALHAAAALALFGLVRRTLLRPPLAARFGRDATLLAFGSALLWAVHPLQSETVICVVQRTESLVGLFYLLTLYAFVRSVDTGRPRLWAALAIAACFLGMASKEVMVSAPLMVLLYDRTFVAGSFRAAWLARWKFYLGQAASWLLLAFLIAGGGGSRGTAAGFGLGVTSWQYLLKQCEAIVHYLRLSVWPHPLVMDYGFDVVDRLSAVLPQALALVTLFALTLLGLWKKPSLGFLGLWFFALLAPSSSIVPLVAQTMAEHRMYLPLAALTTLAVLGGHVLAGKRSIILPLAAALVFGALTFRRTADYRTEISIWADTAARRPANARAHCNLGLALMKSGAVADAVPALAEAVRLKPDYADARQNLATSLLMLGRVEEAVREFERLLVLTPYSGDTHSNFGLALLQAGRHAEALAHGREAVRLLPTDPNTHYNLAGTLAATGHPQEAIIEFEATLRLDPAHGMAHFGLGEVLMAASRRSEAIVHYEHAVRLLPHFAPARAALTAVRP